MASRTKLLVAVIVTALLLPPLIALTVAGAISYGEAEDDADAIDLAALLAPSDEVSAALDAEMAWQFARLTGTDGVVNRVPGSEPMQRTDEAIEAARAVTGSDAADGLATAAESLSGIVESRADAETLAASAPADLTTAPDASVVIEGYEARVEGYHADLSRAIITIDDPHLRRAAEATTLVGQLRVAVPALERDLLLAGATRGLDDPDEIAELAAEIGAVEQLVAELAASPAPYGDVIAATGVVEEVDEITMLATAALSSGTVDVAAVVAADGLDDTLTEARDQIAASYAEAASEAADDADTGGPLVMVVVGVLGTLVAASVLVGSLVRLQRRPSPPAGSPRDGVPPPPASPPEPPVPASSARP